jgi:hypothetical protein
VMDINAQMHQTFPPPPQKKKKCNINGKMKETAACGLAHTLGHAFALASALCGGVLLTFLVMGNLAGHDRWG